MKQAKNKLQQQQHHQQQQQQQQQQQKADKQFYNTNKYMTSIIVLTSMPSFTLISYLIDNYVNM